MNHRRKGGALYNDLKRRIKFLQNENSRENRILFFFSCIRYAFGCTATSYLFDVFFLYLYSVSRYFRTKREQDRVIMKSYLFQILHGKKKFQSEISRARPLQFIKFKGETLYHATTAENAADIMKVGLKPMKMKFVFLTERLCFYDGGRKAWFGEEVILFSVDAKKATELGHSIYFTDCCDYVSDYIPPECLKKIMEFKNGICYDKNTESFI